MNLEKKIRKLKLEPLNDELRHELAIEKDKAHLLEAYDYFKIVDGSPYLYSTKFLEECSYRQILKGQRRTPMKYLEHKTDVLLFKLEIYLMKTRVNLIRLVRGDW